MANAKKCDRCGKFFEYGVDNCPGVNGRNVRIIRLLDEGLKFNLKTLDICPECALGLCEWFHIPYKMRGGEKNEGE